MSNKQNLNIYLTNFCKKKNEIVQNIKYTKKKNINNILKYIHF